jgi:branched-chain amino acid aminotransferase
MDATDATVAVLDHGVTVGDGAFETLKVVDHEPFAITRHLRRLRRSLDVLGITLDRSDDELRDAARAVCATDRSADADDRGPAPESVGVVRITVTGGLSPIGSTRGDDGPTVFVVGGPLTPWPATTAVVTVPWRRNEHSAVAGAKTTSYAENVRALAEAKRAGASEAILANTAGHLCEGTGTNVFVAIDGRLVTPGLATGCLAGVTRELLLEREISSERDDLTLDDLRNADEAFLTSSTRDVQAISTVDGVDLPSCPGPLTKAAAEAFAAIVAESLDP